jgi:tape measure domain-containing protein
MEFIEFLSPNALRDLEKANRELLQMIQSVNTIGANIGNITMPSQNDAEIRRLNAELTRQQQLITDLTNRLATLSTARGTNATRTREQIIEQRALTQAEDREIRATNALVGAYANLNARHQQARINLQNLIASQTASTREIRRAQREYDILDRRITQADRAVRVFNRNVGNYPQQALSGIRNLIGAFGIVGGVSLFASIATDIYQTTKELQGLDMALKQVSGSNEQFARSQAFLSEIAQDFGLEIKGLTRQFTQFYVSAKDKLSATQIEGIFRSISKAGAVMGLSIDNQNRAFLALNQMMSKGTVQAEELRGQLGEALPGAFGIMAKAMGTTEKGLAKLMKDGKVLADEVLPKFARELEKVYGIETIENVETLTASTNRLSNSWTDFIRSLNESETGGISRFFKFMVDGLNSILGLLLQANKDFKTLQKEVGQDFYKNEQKQVFEFAKNAADIGKKRFKTEKEYLDRIRELEVKDAKDRLLRAEYTLQELKHKQEDVAFTLNIEEKQSKNFVTGGIFNLRDLNKAKKAFEDNVLAISNTEQRIKALKDILGGQTQIQEKSTEKTNDNTKATDKNTDSKKNNEKETIKEIKSIQDVIKLKEDEKEAELGSKKWLDDNISSYKKQIDLLAKGSEEYDRAVKSLEYYEYWLELVYGAGEKNAKSLEEQKDKLKEFQDSFRKGFVDEFANNSGFDKLFFLFDNFEMLKESGVDTALAISEAFQQAFNTISEMSGANYDVMYSNLEQQKEVAILFAGESTVAREEIERQYEERRKEIQRKQAEDQKKLAMFNIAVNTAQGIMATVGKTGFAGLPLALIIGALGAAQLAMVASQKIPAFKDGGIHEGGLMLVNDGAGSNYQEKVITPDGKIIEPQGRNVLMNAPKGTQIFTHDQWKDQMNNILLSNGIAPLQQNYNGLTKSDLEDVMSRNLNRDSYNFVIDENGIKKTISRGTATTNILNSRIRIKSRNLR